MKMSNYLVKVFKRYKSDYKAEYNTLKSEQGSFRIVMAKKMER